MGGVDEAIKEAQQRAMERRDNKSEILIINKETDEVVDRYFQYPDAAKRFAENKIWNRPYLAYQIITVVL